MEIHKYYVAGKETIYNLVIASVMILLYLLIYNIGSWIVLKDVHLAREIIELSPLLGIFAMILGAFSLRRCFDSRVKPKFSICSHFLIIGYSDAITIPWDEIHFISVEQDKIKIKFKIGSRIVTRKETIKHVINKEDLIEKISNYCKKYQKDFLQE